MPSVNKLRINGVEYDLSGGGGGGTTNYNELTNKPKINNTELSGNKTSSQLGFGTASAKNVPESGDAGSTEVVMGNDTRLSDSRPASDVYTWAKASTKPTYTKSEVGLSDVPNVTTDNQKPTVTEASTRANIASGDNLKTIIGKIKKYFTDLKDLAFIAKDGTSSSTTKYLRGDGTWQTFPTIPTVGNGTLTIQKNGDTVKTFTANQSGNVEANIIVPTTAADVNAVKYDGDLRDSIGQHTPAAATKTYFDNNVLNNKVEAAYNSSGNEYSILFGRGGSDQYGNVLKWGYDDRYLRILRKKQGTWQSDDWEKIYAGYADTAGSATDSTKVAKAGDTMTGKLTANGRLASPTSGGTYISQKDPTKAALNITTDAVVNGSRYDNIIAGKSTDDSTWSIGIIDNTICFGRFSSTQTDNNFTNVIRIPLATKTGTVATTTELTNGSVTKVGTGNVGSATNPMYLNAGVPTACSYSLNKSVPSDAKFTDTTYNFAGNTFYSGDQNNSEHNANNAIKNGHYYYTSNGPTTSIGASGNDGALYVQQYSDSWVAQIAQDYRNGNLFVRGKNNGTWKSWVKILHERCDSPSFVNEITICNDDPIGAVATRVSTAGVETGGTVRVTGSGSEYNYSELRDDGVYINGTPLQPKIPVNPSSSEKQYLTFWIEVDYEPLSTPNEF